MAKTTPKHRTVTKTTAAATHAGHDPIFAAIERHRAAFMRQMAKDRVHSSMPNTGPDYREDEYMATCLASSVACASAAAAADELTKLPPTTMAGVLALIEYVEAFNAGGLAFPEDPYNWSSAPIAWPADVDKNGIDLFGYSVLANVRRALEALAVQS
jgi:hypothetical protein